MLFTETLLVLFSALNVLGSLDLGSADVLHYGTPESVSLLPEPFVELEANITNYLTPANYGAATFNAVHPLYPGATVLVGHESTIVSHFAVGYSNKYADANGTELPDDQKIKTTKDTIYDMASLTKLFVTIATLQQLDRRAIKLNETVATYLPEFAKNGKANITVQMLLTHTSGFDADPAPGLLNGYDNYAARKTAVIEQHIINPPGSTYLYSDLNFMNLQFLLETVTNTPLDTLIHDEFTAPLGMVDTWYNRGDLEGPGQVPNYARVAATEFQTAVLGSVEPMRPQPVRGTVHDENAWSLEGVAGHAGLFSTAKDLAIFCQMILNNGTYGSTRILEASTVDLIFHNFNTAFPGDAHGLGFELDQFYFSGPMASLQTAGHTGFTGTTMVIDRPSNTFFIYLCHRVHPSRNWSSNNIAREMVGYFVAKALGRDL